MKVMSVRMLSSVAAGWVLAGSIAFAAPAATDTAGDASSSQIITRSTFREVAKKVCPAVVNIKIKSGIEFGRGAKAGRPTLPQNFPLDDQMREMLEKLLERESPNWSMRDREGYRYASSASGVIVRADGYVVTSNHVVDKARPEDIEVCLADPDSRTFDKVRIVGRDELTDLAVLKIEGASNLPFLQWGNSDTVEVGDHVLAVGNPLEFTNSVSDGIVAAKHRTIKKTAIEDLIQTTAMINPGNSGGALVDLDGKLIGINMAIATSTGLWSGLGFAIPSKSAKTISDQLIDGGRVKRGYLGIQMDSLTAGFAQRFDYTNDYGIIVVDVTANGAAERAGLQRYDIIAKVDGKEIKDLYDMHRQIGVRNVGDSVEVEVYRENASGKLEQRRIKVALDERPPQEEIENIMKGGAAQAEPKLPGEKPDSDLLGMKVAPSPKGKGLVVQEVTPGSRAALADIAVGDRILEVNKEPVSSDQDIRKALRARSDDKHIIYLEKKDGGSRFATVTER